MRPNLLLVLAILTLSGPFAGAGDKRPKAPEINPQPKSGKKLTIALVPGEKAQDDDKAAKEKGKKRPAVIGSPGSGGATPAPAGRAGRPGGAGGASSGDREEPKQKVFAGGALRITGKGQGGAAGEAGKKDETPPLPPRVAGNRTVRTKAGTIEFKGDTGPVNPDDVEAGDREGEVTYVDRHGIVRRVYTNEHLQWVRETFGDDVGDLAEKANDKQGRGGVKDAIRLTRDLEITGDDPNDAKRRVGEYLDKPTGKARGELLEDALARNKIIPEGLKGTGRTPKQLIDLATAHAILGGSIPSRGLTPELVGDLDAVKYGRMTKDAFLAKWVNNPEIDGDSSAGQGGVPGMTVPGFGMKGNGHERSGGAGGSGVSESSGSSGHPAQGGDHDGSGDGGDSSGVDPGSGGDDGAAIGGNGAGDQGSTGSSDDDSAATGDDGGASYTVTGIDHNEDGTTTVFWTRSGGDDGQDGNYTTHYDGMGGYHVEDEDGNVVGAGEGQPPKDEVVGQTTNHVEGDEAVFATDDEEESDDDSSESGDAGTSGTGAEGQVGFTPNPDSTGGLPPGFEFIGLPKRTVSGVGLGNSNPGNTDPTDDDTGTGGRAPTGRPTLGAIKAMHEAKRSLIVNPGQDGARRRPGDLGEAPGKRDDGRTDPPREGSGSGSGSN